MAAAAAARSQTQLHIKRYNKKQCTLALRALGSLLQRSLPHPITDRTKGGAVAIPFPLGASNLSYAKSRIQ